MFKEHLQVARDLLHPIDWSGFRDHAEAMALLPACLDHILALPEGRKRFGDTVLKMTKAFALCGTLEEALALDGELAFLHAVRAPLIKGESKGGDGRPPKDVDGALQQLLSGALGNPSVLLPETTNTELLCALQNTCRTRIPWIADEHIHLQGIGEAIHADVCAVAGRDGVVLRCRDVSERRHAAGAVAIGHGDGQRPALRQLSSPWRGGC